MIFINAAHGGYDLGGSTNVYFKEKDLTLKISQYQAKRLAELGLEVKLVRDDDYFLSLSDRITIINNLVNQDDVVISNHLNYGADQGAEIIYSLKTKPDLPNILSHSLKNSGQDVRNVYQKFDRFGLDFYDILKYPLCSNKVMIFYGFVDGQKDIDILIYHWMDIAEGIVKGITDYLQIPYQPPKTLIHVVLPNESIYDIASKYQTSPEIIKKDNHLPTDILYPRAELIINI